MSLIDNITGILQAQGHPDPHAWKEHEFISIAIGSPTDEERLSVNRYWRQWLSGLNVNTMGARFFLRDDTPDSTYLDTFAEMVAPIIVENSQPRQVA